MHADPRWLWVSASADYREHTHALQAGPICPCMTVHEIASICSHLNRLLPYSMCDGSCMLWQNAEAHACAAGEYAISCRAQTDQRDKIDLSSLSQHCKQAWEPANLDRLVGYGVGDDW